MDLLAGYGAFHWVATWANPGLDAFFRIVTDLGSHTLYYFVCAPLFWVVDRRQASVLFLLIMVSAYVNTAVKLGFNTPRPNPALARVIDLRPLQEHSASFPSGHTQGAVVFWGFVALWIARRWVSVLCALMIVLISFSRIYLGAHFPIDVLGGLILGAATMWIAPRPLLQLAERNFEGTAQFVGAALLASLAATVLSRDPSLAMLSGCLLGFFLATVWLPQPAAVRASTPQRVAAAGVGVLILAPVAGIIAKLAAQPLALFVAISLLWVVTLWVYPHALARILPAPAAAFESE